MPNTAIRSITIRSTFVAVATMATLSQAHAIDCDQGFQRVRGSQIATPYCQDEYLAQVAREFGVKASAERIRNNPSYKREVCRIAGRDIRIQQACVNENSLSHGRR
jgi:hypothetical protein